METTPAHDGWHAKLKLHRHRMGLKQSRALRRLLLVRLELDGREVLHRTRRRVWCGVEFGEPGEGVETLHWGHT